MFEDGPVDALKEATIVPFNRAVKVVVPDCDVPNAIAAEVTGWLKNMLNGLLAGTNGLKLPMHVVIPFFTLDKPEFQTGE